MTETSSHLKSESPRFKFFPQLNSLPDLSWTATDTFLTPGLASRHFSSERMNDKLARALAKAEALPVKELLESCEFFERVRKEIRAETVADLCCGHGLLGLLFAIFERKTLQVSLIDQIQAPSHVKILDQAAQLAPWIRGKLSFQQGTIDQATEILESNTSIVSAHACGLLTDACLETPVHHSGNVAVMPCCYPKRQCPAPPAIESALGNELAYDVDRTYRLERADYHVRWSAIPRPITPMNRILIGRKRVH